MKDVWQLLVFVGLGAVLFLPLVVSDGMFFPFITGKNFGFRIIVEITLAAWILLALYEPQYRPRFSWLLPSVGALLAVMLLANLFGEYSPRSFWSNYERMDGYVTLVHFAAYFLVLGSMLSHKTTNLFGRSVNTWYVFMLTALGAALLVSITAFQQLAGLVENTRDGWRINGTLGNAAYMAIYMLFNVFVSLWVALHSRVTWLRVTSLLLAGMFVFLLVQTGTRGTILGLAGGTFLGALYIAIFNTQYPLIRKMAVGAVVAVIVAAGSLTLFRDSAFVNDSIILKRATAINMTELNLRMTIWGVGLDGVAERPLLGWGQGNFNYVFNTYYEPNIAGRAEEWYDRAHNIFVDWLVTGGVLGLVAYLSIWCIAAYYVLVVPHRKRESVPVFTVTERGLLLAIFAGYFIHNLVVFDNIVSYIFFAVILAMVHARVSENKSPWPAQQYQPAVISNIATPAIIVVAVLVVYVVNVPSMQAARDLIDGYRTNDPVARLEAFETAFSREGFAFQELTEQLVQQALNMSSDANVPAEVRQAYLDAAEVRIQELLAEKPGDARVYVFAASYYRTIQQFERAREYGDLAIEYTPEKATVYLDRGFIEYLATDYEEMLRFFKMGYDLNPANPNAQVTYAAGLLLTGAPESEWRPLFTSDAYYDRFLQDGFALTAANATENFALLEEMFEAKVAATPANPQFWMSLAVSQYQQGDTEAAVATLKELEVRIPSVAAVASCVAGNIEAGEDPNQGC